MITISKDRLYFFDCDNFNPVVFNSFAMNYQNINVNKTMKNLILATFFLIGIQQVSAQNFTRKDSLQGGLRPERTSFNVLRYDLNIKINPDEKSIIGFNDPVKDKLNKTVSLKYWKSEIKIYFTNSIPKKSMKSLLNFAELISNDIDPLKISEVKDIKDSNYIVYQESDYNHSDGLKNSKTDFYISWNGRNIIYKEFIKINS